MERGGVCCGENLTLLFRCWSEQTSSGLGHEVSCVQGVQLSDDGVYRFDVHQVLGETFCRLKVYKGAAAVQMPSFTWVLTAGKTIDLNRSCGDHTPRDEFNTAEIDGLDRWSPVGIGRRGARPFKRPPDGVPIMAPKGQ